MAAKKSRAGVVHRAKKEKDKPVDDMVKEYKQMVKDGGNDYSLQIVISEIMRPTWKKPRRRIEWAAVVGPVEGGNEPDPDDGSTPLPPPL